MEQFASNLLLEFDQHSSTVATLIDVTAGWELALVTAPSSNETATASSKLAGGLDKLTLDNLYDDAVRRTNQTTSYNPWELGPMTAPDPFYASNMMAASHNKQMEAIAQQQQQAFMLHQQQQMIMMNPQQEQGSKPLATHMGMVLTPITHSLRCASSTQ